MSQEELNSVLNHLRFLKSRFEADKKSLTRTDFTNRSSLIDARYDVSKKIKQLCRLFIID